MASGVQVNLITLGCAKNVVDSEEIAGVLQEAGYVVGTENTSASVTIINTCGFLQASREESLQTIREAVQMKRQGKTDRVIVAGCLTQRLGTDMMRLAPGADAYIGVGQMARFAEIVGRVKDDREQIFDVTPPQHRWADVETRARNGNPWSAYLKVSEGCDHKCTFCTIPSFRGGHQSKPIERVIEEARRLARLGVKEVNLIAQDVTQYGYDLYQEFTLPKLLRELNAIDGLKWIRILYFYPNRLTDEVIEAMAGLEHVLPYIDIPLQHTHPDVLRRMKRPWEGDRYLKVFDKVRAAMPDVAIRTTFIVGFPGETEEEFQHLMDFCAVARLDRVGAFMFSREPGTPSYDMDGQLPHRVKEERYRRLMELQQGISREKNLEWVGKPIQLLMEGERDGWGIGRSFRDAPEIDGLVFTEGIHAPGSLVNATVFGAEEYDLFARVSSMPMETRRPMQALRLASPARPL